MAKTKLPPTGTEIIALCARLRELSQPPYDSAVFGGPMKSAAEALDHMLYENAGLKQTVAGQADNGRAITKLLTETEADVDALLAALTMVREHFDGKRDPRDWVTTEGVVRSALASVSA